MSQPGAPQLDDPWKSIHSCKHPHKQRIDNCRFAFHHLPQETLIFSVASYSHLSFSSTVFGSLIACVFKRKWSLMFHVFKTIVTVILNFIVQLLLPSMYKLNSFCKCFVLSLHPVTLLKPLVCFSRFFGYILQGFFVFTVMCFVEIVENICFPFINFLIVLCLLDLPLLCWLNTQAVDILALFLIFGRKCWVFQHLVWCWL